MVQIRFQIEYLQKISELYTSGLDLIKSEIERMLQPTAEVNDHDV